MTFVSFNAQYINKFIIIIIIIIIFLPGYLSSFNSLMFLMVSKGKVQYLLLRTLFDMVISSSLV